MTLDVYERQVPLQPMFDYVDSPSTTTTAFHFVTVKAERTSSTMKTRTRVQLPSTLDIYKNVYNYRRHVNNYFRRRPMNAYFLYTAPNANRLV